jgi:putative aldouronate transport system permease protein
MGKRKPKEGMVEASGVASKIADIVSTLALCAVVFVCVIPLWHVIMSSLSNGKALFAHEGLVLLPSKELNFDAYKLVFKDASIIRAYAVTLFYVAATPICGLVLNVLGGYVLSRSSKLKPFLTMLVIVSMMFSGGIVPLYMVVHALGWVGTPLAVIIPGCTNAIFMIMMMNAFMQVPQATVEAAEVDGAGHLRLMFQVILPQARGMMLVTILNSAIMAWNAWFEATIYMPTKKAWWPLQLWIRELTSSNKDFLNYANPDYNRYLVQYVVIVIATLPVLIIFPFFQKRLEQNMVMGAVKE